MFSGCSSQERPSCLHPGPLSWGRPLLILRSSHLLGRGRHSADSPQLSSPIGADGGPAPAFKKGPLSSTLTPPALVKGNNFSLPLEKQSKRNQTTTSSIIKPKPRHHGGASPPQPAPRAPNRYSHCPFPSYKASWWERAQYSWCSTFNSHRGQLPCDDTVHAFQCLKMQKKT